MKTIMSADNALYKSLRALNTQKGRAEQGLFIAEGPHLVEEALRSGGPVRFIVVRDDSAGRFAELLRAGVGAEVLALTPRLFDALADTESPQGVLAVSEFTKKRLNELDIEHDRMGVILERIQDPGNLGTILRTALAVDAGFAVLTEDSADPWSQKAVRASQGAVFHIDIAIEKSAAEAAAYLNGLGWHTACGHLDGDDFFKRPAHARTALLIGNEASGASPEAAQACAARYRLPMPGRAESLNAAVAAGIMLYDLWREQQNS